MIRRVVDLTLTVHPQRGRHAEILPRRLPPDIEPSGPERPRKDIQRLCLVRPYHIGDQPEDVAVDVTLGDSLPHTHAESLWINEVTILGKIPDASKWCVRDIATVPAAEFTREAAVVDASGTEDRKITARLLAERAEHVRTGDFVLLRTGFLNEYGTSKAMPELVRDEAYLANRPGLTMDAAEWLVRDRQIVGIAADVAGGLAELPNQGVTVHTYFYMNAVLMIDEAVNFDALTSERVFFCGGVSLRTAGIGSSPARPVALPLDQRQWPQGSVDMFQAIQPTEGTLPPPPYSRIEPEALRGELYKRYDIRWLQISFDEAHEQRNSKRGAVRPQRDFGSPIRTFSSRLGTHMLGANRSVTTKDLIAPAQLLDLSLAGPNHVIRRHEIESAAARANLTPGRAAVVRTDYSDLYYHRPDYLQYSPSFDPDALVWLAQEGVTLVVSDTVALDPDGARADASAAIEACGLPVVLGATNLWMLRRQEFHVVFAPVPLIGTDSLPGRLVAIEHWH